MKSNNYVWILFDGPRIHKVTSLLRFAQEASIKDDLCEKEVFILKCGVDNNEKISKCPECRNLYLYCTCEDS